MTEGEARAWIEARYDTGVVARLDAFAAMVASENAHQNLISPASVATMWSRHIVDSAQLIAFAPDGATHWLDIGTGGGFPGIVIALCWPGRTIMVEPRRRRAEFLGTAIAAFGLADRSTVHAIKVEALTTPANVISARAVGSIEKLLQAAGQCATPATRWILPRGRSSTDDFGDAMFHVEHSITDPASRIVLMDGTGK